jgi:hypothetical protein
VVTFYVSLGLTIATSIIFALAWKAVVFTVGLNVRRRAFEAAGLPPEPPRTWGSLLKEFVVRLCLGIDEEALVDALKKLKKKSEHV